MTMRKKDLFSSLSVYLSQLFDFEIPLSEAGLKLLFSFLQTNNKTFSDPER